MTVRHRRLIAAFVAGLVLGVAAAYVAIRLRRSPSD
jgi:hypothetical protein